ncbi:MAG: cold shock domain-containing protein [Paracoccus sp. (in: a-proteobacteria)]|nr:cold shock domain-containing protein [Paracoccus sp. (in: a-proteobacteria)]
MDAGDATTGDRGDPVEVSGAVKWFDPVRGFGFVVSDGEGPDILLHGNVLRNFGQSSITELTRVRVMVQQTVRGLQAVRLLEVEPAEAGAVPAIGDLADTPPGDLEMLPFLPARVKWFDRGKGFGFANLFGEDEDVFLHSEVLRVSGLADLAVGEAVALRVVDGRRGLMAAQIAPWERGGRPAAGAGMS